MIFRQIFRQKKQKYFGFWELRKTRPKCTKIDLLDFRVFFLILWSFYWNLHVSKFVKSTFFQTHISPKRLERIEIWFYFRDQDVTRLGHNVTEFRHHVTLTHKWNDFISISYLFSFYFFLPPFKNDDFRNSNFGLSQPSIGSNFGILKTEWFSVWSQLAS